MNWLIWAIIFFILSIVAGAFGFGLISNTSYAIAKVLALIFIVLFIISVILIIIKKL